MGLDSAWNIKYCNAIMTDIWTVMSAVTESKNCRGRKGPQEINEPNPHAKAGTLL